MVWPNEGFLALRVDNICIQKAKENGGFLECFESIIKTHFVFVREIFSEGIRHH